MLICAVSPADWMASRKKKIVAMDFVSALRRIAEVIELEKASGGALSRGSARPRVRSSGYPRSPVASPHRRRHQVSSKNLGRTLLTARSPVAGPAGKLANLPEGCRSRPAGSRERFDGATNAVERL